MEFKIFIHTNYKQLFGAKLSKFSFLSIGGIKNKDQIEIIELEKKENLYNKENRLYLRSGVKVPWKNNDLQSFTPLRFLPPQLMNYKGRALIVDPDVFCLKDISDLINMDLEDKAIACCAENRNGKIKYKTSVMLLDCSKLTHWNWDLTIEKLFNFEIDYRKWMSLEYEANNTIKIIPDHWNHYDYLDENTRMIHFTKRITQPWKTGLPVDFGYDPIKLGVLRKLKSFLTRPRRYQENPSLPQQKYFFELANSAVNLGEISNLEVLSEIKNRNIRKDFLQCLDDFSKT